MKLNSIALAQLLLSVASGAQSEQVSGCSCGDKTEAESSPDRKLTTPKKGKGKKKDKKSKAQAPTVAPTGECSLELFQGGCMYVGGICKNVFGGKSTQTSIANPDRMWYDH